MIQGTLRPPLSHSEILALGLPGYLFLYKNIRFLLVLIHMSFHSFPSKRLEHEGMTSTRLLGG